jgi:hypothetical protein
VTEAEWLAATYPKTMLEFFRKKNCNRKLRLFAVACCRRLSDMLKPEQRSQLETAESYADGHIPEDDYFAAFSDPDLAHYFRLSWPHFCRFAVNSLGWPDDPTSAAATRWPANWTHNPEEDGVDCIARTARLAATTVGYRETDTKGNAPTPGPPYERLRLVEIRESASQTELLRDIFGNPFNPIRSELTWRTSTVIAIAHQMYESRDFSAMPILADALQDAGCEHEDILNHCRDEKRVHVRGCWVVDLVLGRAATGEVGAP